MIRLENVSKTFGENRVLRGLNLHVPRGTSMVIIGGSGTGKSVTIKCIQGLLEPDSGSIEIDGQSVVGIRGAERERINRKIGMLFQGGALFDSLPVWQNVAFRLRQHMPDAKARAIAVERLGRVGLPPETAGLMPAELSGGMARRVGLARAIAHDPAVIFFDEPTTGLDPIRARSINALIRGIVRETGATAITITHDMDSVRAIGDRVALLQDGRIAWDGPVVRMDDAAPLADFLGHRPADGT